jgi:hypothetical protein
MTFLKKLIKSKKYRPLEGTNVAQVNRFNSKDAFFTMNEYLADEEVERDLDFSPRVNFELVDRVGGGFKLELNALRKYLQSVGGKQRKKLKLHLLN